MKTGKEIQSLEDIKMLVVYLCTSQQSFTQQDIFVLAKQAMEGSHLIVNKLLKTLITQTVDFLVDKCLLTENNGIYSQINYLCDKTESEVESI